MGRLQASRTLPLVLAALLLGACNMGSDVSRQLGARCQDHDECDGLCLQGAMYPDGFCSINCGEDSDCPGASRCADIEQGVCLFSCREPADCEFLGAGWSCTQLTGRPDGAAVMVCAGAGGGGM